MRPSAKALCSARWRAFSAKTLCQINHTSPNVFRGHKNIVDNVRALAVEHRLHTNNFTDKECFDLWQECYFCDDYEAEELESIRAKQ